MTMLAGRLLDRRAWNRLIGPVSPSRLTPQWRDRDRCLDVLDAVVAGGRTPITACLRTTGPTHAQPAVSADDVAQARGVKVGRPRELTAH
jgi:hypothetical protein